MPYPYSAKLGRFMDKDPWWRQVVAAIFIAIILLAISLGICLVLFMKK